MQPWIDGESIDKEVAEENLCTECGGECRFESERGVDYYNEPYYEAFAVCTECDHREEF